MWKHLTSEEREQLGLTCESIRALRTRLANARFRCTNSKSKGHIKHYQSKGITVCDEWQRNPKAFLFWAKDKYAEGLELDRIDNSKGYSPENCRFVTIKQGRRNRSNCRSFDVLRAIDVLRGSGFSEVFINQHFPVPHG